MRLHRSHEEAPHSHLMRAGDPVEQVVVQHGDGSFSRVEMHMEGDELAIELRPSATHPTHLTGM